MANNTAKSTAFILPAQTTSFVGRDQQIEEICSLLQKPECRLLTLKGPGGIGKTRLAIAVAETCEMPVAYAPLQVVSSPSLVPSAIADAMGIPLSGNQPLRDQVLEHLRSKRLLLVLDNFEHLLDGADLLLDIIRMAPEVRLLLTSRESLNLREEWLYAVPGLTYPRQEEILALTVSDLAKFGAVQLFVARAQQVRHNFNLNDDVDSVVAICRAVDGMPLAIELAASWLRALDPAAIAGQLSGSLDFLTAHLQNVPERHQSIRTVFDGSWNMLSEQDRNVFATLTVFKGGFTSEAAKEVSGASVQVLASLVSKSLLYRLEGSRFQIHELLRQYAAEKLQDSARMLADAERAHAYYYLRLLPQQRKSVHNTTDRRSAQRLLLELDNIRKAWNWAIETQTLEEFQDALLPLHNLHQAQSRYVEGADLFFEAARCLDKGSITRERAALLVELLAHYGWFCLRLGNLEGAEAGLKRARDLYHQFDVVVVMPVTRHPLVPSMFIALARGEHEKAMLLGEEILNMVGSLEDPGYLFGPLFGLASANLAVGDYARAGVYAKRGLDMAAEHQNVRDSNFHHGILGKIALLQGDLRLAEHHFGAALQVGEMLEEPACIAEHLANLADVALQRGDLHEARRLYSRSLGTYEQVGDRGGLARTALGLGEAAWKSAEAAAAHAYLRRALEVAEEAKLVPLQLRIAAVAGDLLLHGDNTRALGRRTLDFVAQHPSCDAETQMRLAESAKRSGHTPVPVGRAVSESFSSLDSLVTLLQAQLAEKVLPSEQLPPLVEPLTAREQEVLRLLADGHTNAAIADTLVISVGTVKAHTSSIYGKLDVANRTQAAQRARDLGLIA